MGRDRRLGAAGVVAGLFAIVAGFGAAAAVAGVTPDPVRGEAEALAAAASREFDAIEGRRRVAEAPGSGTAAADQGGAWGWFQRPRQDFQALMQMLATGRLQARSGQETHGMAASMTASGSGVAATQPQTQLAQGQGQSQPSPDKAQKTENADKSEKKGTGASPSGGDVRQPPLTRDSRPGAATKPTRDAPQPPSRKGTATAPKPEAPPSVPPAPSRGAPQAQAPAGTATPAPGGPSASSEAAGKTARIRRSPPGRRTEATARDTRRRAPACRAAGARVRTPGWYVVRRGDTLSGIARRHYGSARFYRGIHAANRGRLASPHRIPPCQRLYLPRAPRR